MATWGHGAMAADEAQTQTWPRPMMLQSGTQRMHGSCCSSLTCSLNLNTSDKHDAPVAASKAAQFFKERAGRKAAQQQAYQHWRDKHHHALLTTNGLNLHPPATMDVEASIRVDRFFNEPGCRDLPLPARLPMQIKLASQKASHPKAPAPPPSEAPSWPGPSALSVMSTAMPEDSSSSAEDVPMLEVVKTCYDKGPSCSGARAASRSQPHQPFQASAFAKAPPPCPGGPAVADGTAASSTDSFSYWS